MRVWPLAVLGTGLVAASACNEVQSYVFSARRFDPDAGCLAEYTSIEQIAGRGAGNGCPATCFRFDNAIYTTRICPPLPEAVEELDQASPECVAANEPNLYDASCSRSEDSDAAVLDASSEED